jgi:hypothetical protein
MTITKDQAAERARRQATAHVFEVSDVLPKQCSVYRAPEGCWYVLLQDSSKDLLAGSRLICIDKETAEVLHDGPAGDEG